MEHSFILFLFNSTNHGPGYSKFGRRSYEASQVVSQRKPLHKTIKPNNTNKSKVINIGTRNVRTVLRAGNLEEVKNIMTQRNIEILGLCESRWQGNNDFNCDEFRVITRGNEI